MFVIACIVVVLLIWFENRFYDHELIHPIVRYTVGTLTIFVGMVIWLGADGWRVLAGLLVIDGVAGMATLSTRVWARILNRMATRGLNDGRTSERGGLEGLYHRTIARMHGFITRKRGGRN